MTQPQPTTSARGLWRRNQENILASAAALMAERGYQGTTMQDIADRAACSVGYLYKHFPGKLELARVLVEREIDELERAEARVRERGLPPLLAYRELLEELGKFLVERWPLVRIFAGDSVLRNLPATRDRFAWVRRRDTELLAQARRCGDLPDIDTELLCAVLHGVIDELITYLTAGSDRAAVRRLPDLVFSLVIDPLRARARANRTSEDTLHADDIT